VEVEWALWGMESRDAGYRVLRCSDSVLAEDNFEYVINRYFPGMLDDLPQVTLGWLASRDGGQQYIALAIHEDPERSRHDPGDSQALSTRCFVVPYPVIATTIASYQGMYEMFQKLPLPDRGGTILTQLPGSAAEVSIDPLAMRVAALLLTCRPVCILGADHLGLGERLRFMDSVMSLLPYGLRSRLSASTLTSSLFWEHKFRLFFASAERGGDHVVRWSERDGGAARPGDEVAATYMEWLANANRLAMLTGSANPLTAFTEPVGFHPGEIKSMLESLYAAPGTPEQSRPYPDDRPVPAGQDPAQGVEALLVDCADRLLGDSPQLISAAIEKLSVHRYDQVTPAQRQRYQEIIKDRQLLRLPIRNAEALDFYKIILQLAFETQLSYPDYCRLEDCAGDEQGHPMRTPLLQAVRNAPQLDFRVLLLVLKALGDQVLDAEPDDQMRSSLLIESAADQELRSEHGRIIYQITVRHLEKQADQLDRRVLREDLRRFGYLAPALHRLYPGEFDVQRTELCRLLRLAYPGSLDWSAIQDILGDQRSGVTHALWAALMSTARPEDAQRMEQAFPAAMPGPAGTTDSPRRPSPSRSRLQIPRDPLSADVNPATTVARLFRRRADGDQE